MTNLINFDFESKNIRVIMIDNNPWFLANDVCSILEYKNPRDAINTHCKAKGVVKRDTLSCDVTKRYTTSISDVAKRDTSSKARKEQLMTYINEPNLYRLITRSKMEAAEKFEEHVFEVILPEIRKTGSYSLTINTEQQYEIKKAVNEKSFETGIHYMTIYTMLYDEFRIPRYDELLASCFDKAIIFIKSIGKVIGGKSNLANAPENLNASRAFALALMTNGARKYDEITRAYGVMKNKLQKIVEQVEEVERMITHIDHNDGAVHDGFAEARIYLFMDGQVRKDSVPIAKKLYKPLNLPNAL